MPNRSQAVDNGRNGSRGRIVVDGYAHQFRARSRQGCYLADGAFDVGGIGIGHRLHHNWCIAADAHASNRGCVCLSAL